jgi:hypothetical protein
LDSNPNSSIIKIDEEIQKQAQSNENEQQQQSLPQQQQSSKNDKVGPTVIFRQRVHAIFRRFSGSC